MSPAARKPAAAHGLPDALQLTEPRRNFGVVLAAIVVAMVFQLAAPARRPEPRSSRSSCRAR